MSRDASFRPHHTGAELVLRVGPTAKITVTVDDGLPIIEVAWGSITLLVMPNSASEGLPITPCDVDRARDLYQATGVYLGALEDLLTAQQTRVPADETTKRELHRSVGPAVQGITALAAANDVRGRVAAAADTTAMTAEDRRDAAATNGQ